MAPALRTHPHSHTPSSKKRYNKGLQAKAALERDVAAYVRASSGSTDSVLAYSLAAKRTYVEVRAWCAVAVAVLPGGGGRG